MEIEFILYNSDEIPEELFVLLKSYPLEFGTGNHLNKIKDPNKELYLIKSTDNNETIGYYWIDKKEESGVLKHYFSIIVLELYKNQCIAKKSLHKAIEIIKSRGISSIYAQVNKYNDNGLIMRKFFISEGFKVIEKREYLKTLNDEEYIVKSYYPVRFQYEIT